MQTTADRQERARRIKLLILDVDGVLTDGRLIYSSRGEILKVFHVHDGLGIKQLLKAGIEVAIISSRKSKAVSRRAAELGIRHVFQGQPDKRIAFKKLLSQLKLDEKQVAYVGDDLPDLPIMQQVGLAIAVTNALPAVQQQAHWKTRKEGGQGAVREVCDFILSCL
ncbi:3-deoxy-manno-octulosonate-8-phosphatase KdsC [Coxiella burnetii]|uniref:3-deoxy-D-manno-octulosonate 8-phosphate phosphatase KdsC n=1 Tax=Coxiella burnetii (strain RSA 493 / Nine Mile phase I) TaxID=227377 RepID=Q83DI2_COXBU|nr:3-deoxy-manno-octulosonate-8-phosphatase KdsC [Coxiella burnetii]NP_819775.1 3-deoxy-manno-octulosonate-8-phosphatase [Coxiella burnetii RSA 493]AAO90289.1 3-deoxy-manno-octulosonate-8-phosphatase [Coxiella burnetii RSA 493]ABX78808.1 3-deoxy-D-manno-octulosonate 8-phosphate phosphatase, YrbI family [Coxiella burnetii RSA 331]AML49350.1 phenylphosphate carboxylase subunit delta [Coxiella burnetii]AML55276.1 phenylphosphate carboxylase subunit delta [Coxiella burnetii]ARI65587.1 phenylphosp